MRVCPGARLKQLPGHINLALLVLHDRPCLQEGRVLGVQRVAAPEELPRIVHVALVALKPRPGQVHIPRAVVHLQALPEQVAHSAPLALRHTMPLSVRSPLGFGVLQERHAC